MSRRAIIILSLVGMISAAGCSKFLHKKPWRDYSKLPFNEQQWKNGDTIERGRMRSDMIDQIKGKTREEVIRMLGEPDKTTNVDGVDYLVYKTEHVGRTDLMETLIGFDKNGKVMRGM
ncbi:MAG: hypothetical protein ABL984_14315 [Pyrinomonadaceae bacterium]